VLSVFAAAQAPAPHTPQELMKALIENERKAMLTKERYEYLSSERSDRTGGHLWTERVVETAQGRVRLLTAVDGQPLSPQRVQQEHDRLTAIAANRLSATMRSMHGICWSFCLSIFCSITCVFRTESGALITVLTRMSRPARLKTRCCTA
jgi:hypothetical protein